MSSLSSESSTSPSSPPPNDDDVEVARGETNTGLKSGDEEEILCNYGDNVLLSDTVSEDGDADGNSGEMVGDGDAIRLSPPKPKPLPPGFMTSKVRFFVGGRVVDKEIVSSVFEKNDGNEEEVDEKEEEVSTGEFSEEFSEEYGKCAFQLFFT